MNIQFIIPGSIDQPTGGYRYDRAIVEGLRKIGHAVSIINLFGDFPLPDEATKQRALEKVAALPKADIVVVDGLAGGSFPTLLEALSKRGKMVALIHHPLCLENGLDETVQSNLRRLEGEGLAHVDGVIAVSSDTALSLSRLFEFDQDKIKIVSPAVKPSVLASGSGSDVTNLLSVGSAIVRKGHDTLIEALSGLKELSWKLEIVGPTHFDETYYSKLEAQIVDYGLRDRISFRGILDEDELELAYQQSDLFVLASRHEGYGMVFAEAITRGIPVIALHVGAVPQTVPQGCGILVEPDNVEALREALHRAIIDDDVKQLLKDNAIASRNVFPSWDEAASRFSNCLKEFS